MALCDEGIFPRCFKNHLHHEVIIMIVRSFWVEYHHISINTQTSIIRWMLEEDPKKRPSAEDISSSPTLEKLKMSSRKSKATIAWF